MIRNVKKFVATLLACVLCLVACPPEALFAATTSLLEYIPFEYDWISVEHKGYVLAEKDGVAGVMNIETKAFEPTGQWTMISTSPGGRSYFPTQINGVNYYSGYTKTGAEMIIKQDGKDVSTVAKMPIRPEDIYIHPSYGDNGKWGIEDSTGKIILAPKYDRVSGFNNGAANFIQGDKMGIISDKGQVIVEAKYDMVVKSALGYTIYDDGKTTSFIDPAGKTTKVKEWRLMTTTGLGFAYQVGRQIGTELNYEDIEVPVYEYALILGNGKIETKYVDIEPVSSNPTRLVATNLEGSNVLMDEHYTVLSATYDYIVPKEEETFMVNRSGKYGIIGDDGKEILPPTYDKPVREIKEDLYTYISGEAFCFLDANGIKMTEPIYATDTTYYWGYDTFLPIGDSQYIPLAILNPNPTKAKEEWQEPKDKWIYGVQKIQISQ